MMEYISCSSAEVNTILFYSNCIYYSDAIVKHKGNGSKLRKVEVKGAMQLSKRARKALSASSSAAAVVDGSASSLVFTPVQGLELVNPNAAKERIAGANSAWFSSNAGFKSAAAPE